MAPDVSGGLRNSPSSGKSNKHVLKKGPWTTSEDMILVEYVKKHGEGNWNAVQRNSGLMRCGKSCRLRWANHLRPNLKKGAFTPEEEQLIVDLHAKMGNKWARMAAQLPGRTDNEIKNYWNTRLKRRQRAGLPIYPQQMLQQEQQHQQLNSSTPSPSLSSLLAPSRPSNPNPLLYYNTFSPSSTISPSQNQLKLYQGNNSGLALSLAASNSSFSTNPFFNQGLSNPLPMPSLLQYNNFDYGVKTGSDMRFLGLPSIQSPVGSSSDFVMGTTSSDDYEVEPSFPECNKSGLLEDLLEESHALANCSEKSKKPLVGGDENLHERNEDFGFGHGNINSDNNYEGQETKARSEANSAIDDDLLNLLDNFPLSVPIPDWDEANGSESPILSNGTNGAIESQPEVVKYNPVATSTGAANQDWNFGSCLNWNNMPSIY